MIMNSYEEFKTIIMATSNTATAARARQEAWQHITDKLNAHHVVQPAIKRTREQVNTKHKNQQWLDFQSYCCSHHPPIVLVGGEEPTNDASPDNEETVSAFYGDVANPAGPWPDPPEPGPSHSAGTGDGEVDQEDVQTLFKHEPLAKQREAASSL